MSPKTLQFLIPAVLIFHGIGHFVGVIPAAGWFSNQNWHARSWLLTNAVGDIPTRVISIVLWVLLGIGFILVGAGAWGWPAMQPSWRSLAVPLAVVSLLAVIVFWNAFPAIHNKLGALGVNIAVLVGLLYANWPSTDLIP
jgi:hypothetical protein